MKQLNDCMMIVRSFFPRPYIVLSYEDFFLVKALWNSACRIYSHCKLSDFILYDVISVLLGTVAVADVDSKPTFAKLVHLYFSTIFKKWNVINICLREICLV